MAPGIGLYNFNMSGSSFSGLLQQGMGMFSGGLGGSGIFMNCYGEVNYDAMAGYAVANALVGVAGQAINSTVSQKQQAKAENENNKLEIKEIEKQIYNKTSEKLELNEEISTKQDLIKSSKDEISSLNEQITDLNVAGKKEAYEAAKNQDPQPENLNELKEAYEEAVKKEAQLKEEISEQENIIKTANENIEANKAAINKLTAEIEELEVKKTELEKAVNEKELDNADGKRWQRTSQKDFDAKWNEDGTMAEGADFTKSDMRYAIAGFRNATTTEDKKYWANKIATIYKNMNQSDITSDFKTARKIVDSYVD